MTGIEGAGSQPVRRIALLSVLVLVGIPPGHRPRSVERHSGGVCRYCNDHRRGLALLWGLDGRWLAALTRYSRSNGCWVI